MRVSNAPAPKKSKHKGLIVLIVLLVLIASLFVDSKFRIVNTEYELYYNFEKFAIQFTSTGKKEKLYRILWSYWNQFV